MMLGESILKPLTPSVNAPLEGVDHVMIIHRCTLFKPPFSISKLHHPWAFEPRKALGQIS
jgi:hypothetical protein